MATEPLSMRLYFQAPYHELARLIGWLGLASLALIAVVTVLVRVAAPDDTAAQGGWLQVAWMSLLRTLDPGTMGGDQGGFVFLGLMLTVTVGGIFIVSSLIGVLTTGLEQRIALLRKGRSKVIERGHAVVLGWSEQVFTVVTELVKANGRRRSCVVILANRDKLDMEDQLHTRVGDTGRTRVICRSGSPLKPAHLDLVNPDAARSIMVLSPPGDDPDIDVIKVLLLLNNRPWPQVRPHVVAAVQDSHNLAAARLAGGEHAQVVDADDIAVRLVAQSHRQSGLSTVCTDLLDFAGNEIYFRAEPTLTGKQFGAVVHAYERGAPIGLYRADGTVALNPPMDTTVTAGDQIILIAEDDLLIRLADGAAPIAEHTIVTAPASRPAPDRTLLVGWNSRAARIIDLVDQLAEPESTLHIAAPEEPDDVLEVLRRNLTVGFTRCQPTSRASLERLDLGSYQHIIVLGDDRIEPDHADDRTLVTLLHLRDIEVRLGDPYAIVTEMHDDANREVAQVTKADDFIVSTRLISLLLTQLAENRHLHAVFTDLFDPAGSEIHLKPAGDYLTPDRAANFATIVEAARRRGHTAIGYRRHHPDADDHSRDQVVLNPDKSAPLTLTASDSVIVLAET